MTAHAGVCTRLNAIADSFLPDRAQGLTLSAVSTSSLERAIAGALRATITDHGPITAEHIGSAVKRIAGNLQNAELGRLAAADLGRRRAASMTKRQMRDFAEGGSAGGRSAWAGLSPAERSAEMKRRAAKRRHSGRPPAL